MNEDVKELLSKAFGPEPPLGIDRDEVLHQGRKRLRRRRLFEAGSVVALVVVVAVGAATLTRLVTTGQEDRMPPAASSTEHAPPGPDLPVPPSYTPSVPPTMETTTTHLALPSDATSAANHLTSLLYASGIVNGKQASPLPNQTGPPQFRLTGDQFTYEADIYRTSSKRGYVQVVVDPSPTIAVDCGNLPSPTNDCEIKFQAGTPVVVAGFVDRYGERTVRVSVLSDSGVSVSATASNQTREDREKGRTPPKSGPVLSGDELCVLVAKVGVVG